MWFRRQRPEVSVVLYTRQGCHLCEVADAVLRQHGLSPEPRDIDADPEWRDRYNTCVPVVVINGKERFRGRVNETLLKRILRSEGT
ncbi:MAG: glutaredoxin family protein [Planctomycetales bacterium]|nr:glutaredoxin family protein [Planctomycetales bacterium]MCA9226020.1 glutaredoxin family protein [Planctomycetales bacterium]